MHRPSDRSGPCPVCLSRPHDAHTMLSDRPHDGCPCPDLVPAASPRHQAPQTRPAPLPTAPPRARPSSDPWPRTDSTTDSRTDSRIAIPCWHDAAPRRRAAEAPVGPPGNWQAIVPTREACPQTHEITTAARTPPSERSCVRMRALRATDGINALVFSPVGDDP